MGLFLSMSGITGKSLTEVEEALTAYAAENGGHFQAMDGDYESSSIMAIDESDEGRITVLYPWNFFNWDDASAFLSARLSAPVFSLHIHDEDLWMYVLFNGGEEVDRFNPVPDYWTDELTEEEAAEWTGDASVIARVWPATPEDSIRNYLVRWDFDTENPGKAYPDDEHDFNDCFQVSDFMKRLGLEYPIDDLGELFGDTYRFEIQSEE